MLSRETLTIIREVIHYAAYWSNPNATMANILKEIDAELQLLSSASTDCNQHKAEEVTEAAYAHGGIKGVQYVEEKAEELKPCPFCGGRVRFIDRNAGPGMRPAGCSMVIACAKCSVQFEFEQRSMVKQMRAFNTRPAAEKVIGERWVLVAPDNSLQPDEHLFEYEKDAEIWLLKIEKGLPAVAGYYRAVKVKIVEVE